MNTEQLYQSRRNESDMNKPTISTDGQSIRIVDAFSYLGSTLTENAGLDQKYKFVKAEPVPLLETFIIACGAWMIYFLKSRYKSVIITSLLSGDQS